MPRQNLCGLAAYSTRYLCSPGPLEGHSSNSFPRVLTRKLVFNSEECINLPFNPITRVCVIPYKDDEF